MPRERYSDVENFGSKKKKKIVCRYYARGWCIKGSSCKFIHIKDASDATLKTDFSSEVSSRVCHPPQQSLDDSKLSSQTMPFGFPDVLASIPSYVGKESSCEGYSSAPLFRGGFVEKNSAWVGKYSSFSNALQDHHTGTLISLFGPGSNEDGTGVPAFGTKSNDEKDYMVLNENRPLDNSISSQPLSSNFMLWSKNLHIENNLGTFESHHDYVEPPFQRNTFPEYGSPSRQHVTVDARPHESQFTSCAWEPSMPFEPQHALIRDLLMRELPESLKFNVIEKAGITGRHMKLSFSDQGSSVKDLNRRSDGSPGDENIMDCAQTGETVGAHVSSTTSYHIDSKGDEQNNETDAKADAVAVKDGRGVGVNGENRLQCEEKALISFKAALVEYVKDLVKPTWREGLMSKDAHKLIVKKSVDKVLCTFQPHQIPVTNESVKSYLSSSHSGLAKLVEAYIERHGKS